MVPEKCLSCKKSYYFKPGESCALTCIRCDRGACIECYEKKKYNLSSSIMFNKCLFFAMNILSGNFDKFYVDCMANSVDKFYSKYSSPGTFGVKFFRSDSLSEGFLFSFC